MFNLKNKIKEKKGVVSAISVLYGVTIFLMLTWLSIDFTFYMQQHRSFKNILDNASASAVTRVSDNSLGTGKIKFETTPGKTPKEIATQILKNDFFLNSDGSPSEKSPLKGTPSFEIKAIDSVNKTTGTVVNTYKGDIIIYEPSVIISARLPMKGLIFKNLSPTVTMVSASNVHY